FTRIVPAASRETTMVLSRSSPATRNVPSTAKVAVTAGSTRSASASRASRARAGLDGRDTLGKPLSRNNFDRNLKPDMARRHLDEKNPPYLSIRKPTLFRPKRIGGENEAPAGPCNRRL